MRPADAVGRGGRHAARRRLDGREDRAALPLRRRARLVRAGCRRDRREDVHRAELVPLLPAQVPGFVALGHTTLPTDEAFQAPRQVESAGAAAPVPPANSAAGAAAEWPTFRGNAERSGACPSAAPTALPIKWRVSTLPDKATPLAAVWHDALAPRLSAPVVAHNTVYVAACCEGEVVALDLATGREIWRAATGSRIDSPPTVHGGLCLTGSHDGYLYAFAC